MQAGWILGVSLSVAGSLFSLPLHAANDAPLSLNEAVETALLHSPQAIAARWNAEAVKARVGQARSTWLPQLNSLTTVRGDYSYQTGTTEGREELRNFRYSSSLQLNQLIYDFGRTGGRIAGAEAGARAAREDAEATRAQLALQAMNSFFTVLQNEALREVAQVNLEQQGRRLQQAESFFKIGTRPQIDVLMAQTATAQARLQLVQAQGNVQTSRAQLLQALGLPEAEWAAWIGRPLLPMLPAPLPLESAVSAPQPGGLPTAIAEAVIEEALAQRPDYQAMKQRVEQAEQVVRWTYGDYLPTLSVGASAGVSGSVSGLSVNTVGGVTRTDVPTQGQPGFSLAGTLTLNWSLFSGLSTVYAVREARALRNAAQANLDALRLQVRSQLQQAALQVITARQSVDAASTLALQADKQLEMARGRYNAGVGNSIELGDAQLASTQAHAQKVQADYGLAQARANLMWQLGRLVSRFQQRTDGSEGGGR
jgi:outer membrane protein